MAAHVIAFAQVEVAPAGVARVAQGRRARRAAVAERTALGRQEGLEGRGGRVRFSSGARAGVITLDQLTAAEDEAKHWPADLVVGGAHGHGPVGRFLLGSVANAVALHAPCRGDRARPSNRAQVQNQGPSHGTSARALMTSSRRVAGRVRLGWNRSTRVRAMPHASKAERDAPRAANGTRAKWRAPPAAAPATGPGFRATRTTSVCRTSAVLPAGASANRRPPRRAPCPSGPLR